MGVSVGSGGISWQWGYQLGGGVLISCKQIPEYQLRVITQVSVGSKYLSISWEQIPEYQLGANTRVLVGSQYPSISWEPISEYHLVAETHVSVGS